MLHMCVQVCMCVVDHSLHSATGRLLAGGEGWEGGGVPQAAAPRELQLLCQIDEWQNWQIPTNCESLVKIVTIRHEGVWA